MASLRFLSGPLAGTKHEFDNEIVLGRSGTDVNIDDPEISRRHLRLVATPDGVLVEDLGSSNGTFLDETKLASGSIVRESAILRIGQTTFQLTGPVVAGGTRISPRPADGTRISERPISTDTAVRRPGAAVGAEAPITQPVSERAPAAQTESVAARSAPRSGARDFGGVAAPAIGVAAGMPTDSPAGYSPVSARRPRRGPATRLLAPAVVTALIIVATAAVLVIYFATR